MKGAPTPVIPRRIIYDHKTEPNIYVIAVQYTDSSIKWVNFNQSFTTFNQLTPTSGGPIIRASFTPSPWDGQAEVKLPTPIPSEISERFVLADWVVEDDGQGHQTGTFKIGELEIVKLDNGAASPLDFPPFPIVEA